MKVFSERDLPFYRVLYRGGNLIAAWDPISPSKIIEKTGRKV